MTRAERLEVIRGLYLAADQLARGFATLDPDDVLALKVLDESIWQMRLTSVRLLAKALSAKVEKAGVSGG